MLREIKDTKQIAGEPARRWFSSEQMDLVVWVSEEGAPIGFQLCYGKPHKERAITWRPGAGWLSHMAVDTGEAAEMRHKASPILVPDGPIDVPSVKSAFGYEASELPQAIRAMVLNRLDSLGFNT